jgi:hypothetical protein
VNACDRTPSAYRIDVEQGRPWYLVERWSSVLGHEQGDPDLGLVPTHRDHPWLKDAKVVHTRFDPADPGASAMLHVAKQLKVIDEARQATSVPPPIVPNIQP